MTEIFDNIREEVKQIAEGSWKIALAQSTPTDAAIFLNNVTEYYRNLFNEEEIEFLKFYFKLQMEKEVIRE